MSVWRGTSVIAIAILLAALLAAGFFIAAPLADPVDIVGPPLVLNYSERTEFAAWILFIAGTMVAGWLLAWTGRDARSFGVAGRLGGIFALGLVSAPMAGLRPDLMLPLAILYAGIFFWGSRAARSRNLAIAGLVAVAIGNTELLLALLWDRPLTILGMVVLLAIVLGITRGPSGAGWRRWLVEWGVPVCLAGLLGMYGPERRLLAALGALAFGLGSAVRPSGPSCFSSPGWVAALVAWGLANAMGSWRGDVLSSAGALLGGAGWAAYFWAVGTAESARFRLQIAAAIAGAWLALLAMSRSMANPWPAFVTILVLVTIWRTPRARRWRFGIVLAGLAFAFPPSPYPSPILDPFHDGVVLSSLWEYESGRTLHDQVVCLRGFEFFSTWMVHRLGGYSLWAYLHVPRLFDATPMVGAALVAWLWTRSLTWSLATGLAISLAGDPDSRLGIHFWLAALALWALASRARWAWLTFAGVTAMTSQLGFDVFVPTLVAGTAALLLSPPRRRGPAFLVGTILLVMLGLTTWQGSGSTLAYWQNLLEYSRNMPPYYGLPLPWSTPQWRPRLIAAMVVGGVWAAGGLLAYPRASEGRRRRWAFLLAQYVLMMGRAIGRSDGTHLFAILYPAILLGSLELFELSRRLRHAGIGRTLLRPGPIGALAALLAAALTPNLVYLPWDLAERYWRQWQQPFEWPKPDPEVVRRVAPEEFLFEWNDGMSYFRNRRHNPTRHAITFEICSPAEQRRSIADLEQHPPKLLIWDAARVDDIPETVRVYVLADYLLARFGPEPSGRFLLPRNGPVTLSPIPDAYFLPIYLKHLPRAWGERRADALEAKRRAKKIVAPWNFSPPRRPSDGPTWECEGTISTEEWNYLCVRLAGEPRSARAELWLAASKNEWEVRAPISWELATDGDEHSYVIPLGPLPAWRWHGRIAGLRLVIESAGAEPPKAELWQIDEGRPDPPSR